MKLRYILTGLVSFIFFFSTTAAEKPSYNAMASKAERFYQHEEWASASALYKLMIEARPTEANLYGRAIVSEAMCNHSGEEIVLFRNALSHHVAFDSVFASVERESFGIGQTNLYQGFLENVKEAEPWLKRTINGYLLRYYSYRHNPEGMIEYSNMLLQGSPDNESFLYSLAQGYLLNGDYNEAVKTYSRIVELNPEAYEALLYLGNYYWYEYQDSSSDLSAKTNAKNLADRYLSQAYSIRPTPYVEKTLSTID